MRISPLTFMSYNTGSVMPYNPNNTGVASAARYSARFPLDAFKREGIGSANTRSSRTLSTLQQPEPSSRQLTKSGADIPFQVFRELELDPGSVEFAIRRIEPLSFSVVRSAQAPHRHDFYEIVWITGGEGTLWIDLNHYPLQPNTMCFLSPGQIHAWEVESTGAGGFVLGFTRRFFAESPDDATALIDLPYFYDVSHAPVLYVNEEQAELFTQTCSQLLREAHLELLGQRALLCSYMKILLLQAGRMHDTQPGAIHVEKAGSALTKQFMLLVEQQYLDTSSVADYAAMLHVTTNHLVETVKANLGQPAGKIIRERLLVEAKRLLRYSDMPVAEIATHLNFEDPSYFSRYFKDKTGFTPTEFREQP